MTRGIGNGDIERTWVNGSDMSTRRRASHRSEPKTEGGLGSGEKQSRSTTTKILLDLDRSL